MARGLDNITVEQLDSHIEYCFQNWELFDKEERVKLVNDYVEAYFGLTGNQPRDSRLTELADFILVEILTDSHPDKVTRTEYPILTNKQVFRRQMKTVFSGDEATIDFLNARYNAWKVGEGKTKVHQRVTKNKGD